MHPHMVLARRQLCVEAHVRHEERQRVRLAHEGNAGLFANDAVRQQDRARRERILATDVWRRGETKLQNALLIRVQVDNRGTAAARNEAVDHTEPCQNFRHAILKANRFGGVRRSGAFFEDANPQSEL